MDESARSSNSGAASSKPKAHSSRSTSLVIRILSALIVLVVANQWHLATHYVRDLHRHDANYFDVSFASFLGQDKNEQLEQHQQKQKFDLEGSYITSPICGPCFRGSVPNSRTNCHDSLQRFLKNNASLADASKMLVDKLSSCEMCLPEKCYAQYSHNKSIIKSDGKHQYKYWRYDRAAPRFTNPTTLTMNSIPNKLRIPPSRFNDIAKYFEEQFWERHNSTSNSTGMEFLFEYNPGIVTLTERLKKSLPKEAAYLVSLRVTQANNCFTTDVYDKLDKLVWDAVYHTSTNHLGLLLLDVNYNILPGYEIVLDMDTQLDLRRVTKQGSSDFGPTFMDYRIFLLNDEVYLHVNADTTMVTKLKLKAKGHDDIERPDNKDPSEDVDGVLYRDFRLSNLYGGDLLEVTVEHQFNTIWSGGLNGKNYALFALSKKTFPEDEDSVYAEIDIAPNHRVQQVVLDEYEHITKQQVFEYLWKPGTQKRRNFKIDKANMRRMKTIGNATEFSDPPFPSFFNVDVPWYPGSNGVFKSTVHGGACCVEFTREQLNTEDKRNTYTHQESLLVGIAHTKVPWRPWYNKASEQEKELLPHTHYVSLFYAFDMHPPFQIRARSGYFCLGFVPETSDNSIPEGGRFNPHSVLTRNRVLKQNGIEFDCPQMSFISSFTQKANDVNSVVIGYGLNDCTGRLVEVTKDEVVRLLFPPLDMVVD